MSQQGRNSSLGETKVVGDARETMAKNRGVMPPQMSCS